MDAVSFWFVWHTFVVHPYTLTQQRLTTLTQPEATLVQLLERPLERIALVAHHIQHTVSTHVQRLYPLIVTGFLQSKHLHTFPFDKFVWARHSTGVKPFTGPASLENMDCYAKIKSYQKIFQSGLRPTRFPWCHFLDFSAALHCHGSRPLPSPSPRSVPSGW